MTADGHRDVFLSCFKCGRIVRSNDAECPRCGLQFGPGTLFECPFCSGLVWRNSTTCSTCGIDLTKFSESVEKSSSGFNMDHFVDALITTEVEQIKEHVRRVACPGCGLMIRGDEKRCPRCDLPLEEAQVDCPVCGEKIPVSSKSCSNCKAVFQGGSPEVVEEAGQGLTAEEEKPTQRPEKPLGKAPKPSKATGAKKAPSKGKAKPAKAGKKGKGTK